MSAAASTTTLETASAFAITTTFTAPTQCPQSVGGLTMLENDGFRIWLNAPLPVPGTTISSCYPDQFISSFLLQTGGLSQAPFSPLVCPAGYTTQGPFTSNYIACCPRFVLPCSISLWQANNLQWLGWLCCRTGCSFRSSSFRRNLLHEYIQRTDSNHLL